MPFSTGSGKRRNVCAWLHHRLTRGSSVGLMGIIGKRYMGKGRSWW